MTRASSALTVVAALFFAGSSGALEEPEAQPSFHNQVAVKAAGGGLFSEHPDGLAGVAAYYEREVVEDVLELELGSTLLVGEHTGIVGIDLLAKHTFLHGEPVDFFVGAGPALDFELDTGSHEQHMAVVPVLLTSAGAHVWVTPHFGLLLETDAGFGLTAQHPIELEGAVGLAYRF